MNESFRRPHVFTGIINQYQMIYNFLQWLYFNLRAFKLYSSSSQICCNFKILCFLMDLSLIFVQGIGLTVRWRIPNVSHWQVLSLRLVISMERILQSSARVFGAKGGFEGRKAHPSFSVLTLTLQPRYLFLVFHLYLVFRCEL